MKAFLINLFPFFSKNERYCLGMEKHWRVNSDRMDLFRVIFMIFDDGLRKKVKYFSFLNWEG